MLGLGCYAGLEAVEGPRRRRMKTVPATGVS